MTRRVAAWFVFIILLLTMPGPAMAAPKRVLVLHSFGDKFTPYAEFVTKFRADLTRPSSDPVDFYETSLVTARFTDSRQDEAPFVDHLRALFPDRRLDLVVAVSETALPPGSNVQFREATIWQQYKWPVAAVVALCILQALFILVLLVYGWRLRRADIERGRAEEAAQELSGRLINAVEEERSRLARELHDDVTQRLALLAIDAGRAERNAANPGGGAAAMRTMREGLVRLSEDVHALSYRLHPSILEDLGLVEALRSECERFVHNCSTPLEADIGDVPGRLPQDVALGLFRIAQEGLRNVARHARAERAEIRLEHVRGGLQLTVRDNGIGFDPARHGNGTSLGHASMRQRAVLLGGKVEIESSPGRGTRITAWVPLTEERSEPSTRAAG